jgi:AraC-like DNA-binding protein
MKRQRKVCCGVRLGKNRTDGLPTSKAGRFCRESQYGHERCATDQTAIFGFARLAFVNLTPNKLPMISATLSPNPSHSTDSFEPIERVENRLVGVAFSPHRHDTYTVALTMSGVQAFNYRGAMRHSLPGQVLILHPDEVHDGHCCDEAGFSYRAAYVPPTHVQTVLGGAELPFVSNGVSTNPALIAAAFNMVIDCAGVEDPGAYEDALYDLVQAMNDVAGKVATARIANRTAVMRAREFLEAAVVFGARLDQLEQVTGCDRWQLSRDFRALLGTSPYRYLQHRRIDLAKRLLREGANLAEAAYGAGFADQSHLGRTFRKAVGLTPREWLRSDLFRTIIL